MPEGWPSRSVRSIGMFVFRPYYCKSGFGGLELCCSLYLKIVLLRVLNLQKFFSIAFSEEELPVRNVVDIVEDVVSELYLWLLC